MVQSVNGVVKYLAKQGLSFPFLSFFCGLPLGTPLEDTDDGEEGILDSTPNGSEESVPDLPDPRLFVVDPLNAESAFWVDDDE